MPRFRLVASAVKRAELWVDEIILSRDEETGEVKHSLSTRQATELPEEAVQNAKEAAGRLGYQLVEVEESPEESEEGESEKQPVGDDVRGMSPANVGRSGGQAGSAAGTDQPAGATSTSPSNPPQGTPAPSPGTTPSTSGGSTSPGSTTTNP